MIPTSPIFFTQSSPWASNWPPQLWTQSNSSAGGRKEKEKGCRESWFLSNRHLRANRLQAQEATWLWTQVFFLRIKTQVIPNVIYSVFCSSFSCKNDSVRAMPITQQFHHFVQSLRKRHTMQKFILLPYSILSHLCTYCPESRTVSGINIIW